MREKQFYQLEQTDHKAILTIYGTIYRSENDDRHQLADKIMLLPNVPVDVYINSRGGSVAEGLNIYNALLRHPAKVTTYNDGFACSAASVVFLAGEERIMSHASLLMIHNAWTFAAGNAKELRKQADDLDTITEPSMNAYMSRVKIEREELARMMDEETWIKPEQAVEWGFATGVDDGKDEGDVSQSVKELIFRQLTEPQTVKVAELIEATVDVSVKHSMKEYLEAASDLTARIEAISRGLKALTPGFEALGADFKAAKEVEEEQKRTFLQQLRASLPGKENENA